MKDFLDKFFDLFREYQQEIPPQKNFHMIPSSKKFKLIGITNMQNILVIKTARFFVIKNLTFRYSYA